ncbi:hypothetical protein COCC4DRAFT_40631 [Bipolaris maydis ATCC 48331]|uniref:Uncharacterized protein n=1 Tax=Cochliobolus heterostrophus (strain C4 / ATCC 48331 / race T) TaxID=665024 RepID=N4XFE7_COCH4|nr:uncharacterized protein COCC4DRAFT_40631 [Bipolaris maydis ATCC 48331]ENI05281.1 hypothetical protein COCC4DRAFT_40631 [Bipolaris maydis ATCC 48331]KAJ5056892.1 hypothetical protein J3E74DRAFT_277588 [Bipolaris maydis]KAJ6194569.1 hypothetical protein J3E72DRAFT_441842 [Bipolaris maydis]KAJ6212379.1 hypothetical protein PSV09DRAFT_2235208 [Bipolaris maydis]
MNRWLNRKKDGVEDAPAGKKVKKGKKGQEEDVKPEFDLNAVLPKADDFRTSLILPGLSTRFSMLREQDDPSSLIGKASDDSVLQPKRQSRLHEFGFVPGGLSDIAEVSSLKGSLHRPAAAERTDSFDGPKEDDGSGSVMSRARPGEGNILFGGRQKIYVISNTNSKGTGRALYDDDVNLSAYQRLRQEEKERIRQQAEDEEESQHSEPSSPTELSRKRETTSSTNSGPSNTRISTAATSIASQGANSVSASSPSLPPSSAPVSPPDLSRSTTKRRLYDQGLDQQIQDQQSSAMNRLNSIQRARAPTLRSNQPLPISQARSATNLHDRFARGPGFRSESPGATGHPAMVRTNSSGTSSPVLSRPQSPPLVSPVTSDCSEAHSLNAALQPNDRGKATALGAFNKPKEAFSEEQYAERLRQMNQDRQARESPASGPAKSMPRKPSLRERAEQERRKRAESDAREKPRPQSPAEQSPATNAFSRFQAAASQMRVAGQPAANVQASQKKPPQNPKDECAKATFFTSPDSSDDEQGQQQQSQQQEEPISKPATTRPAGSARRFENLPVATGPAPPMFEHPALRSRAPSDEDAQQSNPISRSPYQATEPPALNVADNDSPTLGPQNGGLSGLIRQHLRSNSNVSSTYGEPGPPVMSPPMDSAFQKNEFGLQRRQPESESESATPAPSTYSHSNPWDLDDIDGPYREDRGATKPSSPIEGSTRIRPLIMSTSEHHTGSSTWDLTPRRNHERIASNETEAEHEAFQRDLAQRQRLIQESLRAKAEGRSLSPGPGAGPSGGLKNALSMLRAKSNGEAFATVDASNKSVRKLALGSSAVNLSSTSLASMQSSDIPPLRTKPSRVLQQSEQDAQRELEHRQRSATDSSRTGRPVGRTQPVSTRSSTRERSSSGTSSGRSRSRGGHYRDDLDQAMTEGSRAAYPPNTIPSLPGYVAHPTPPLPAPKTSMDSEGRSRSRSNSKVSASNYFESKHLNPIQTNLTPGQNARFPPPHGKLSPGLPVSPRPSPGAYSNHSGQGYSHPNSPMPPFSNSHTPPVSNPTTPNPATPSAPAFNPSTVQPVNRQGMLRKKSVAKSDISDPVFISTTSVIDTIDLPPGASLKNGSEYDAPPVPPINPMRRRFGFGRGEGQGSADADPAVQPGIEVPRAPFAEPLRTGSADGLYEQAHPPPRNMLRKATSEGRSLRGVAQGQMGPSPPVPSSGFQGRNKSPPRAMNAQARGQGSVEGAMF